MAHERLGLANGDDGRTRVTELVRDDDIAGPQTVGPITVPINHDHLNILLPAEHVLHNAAVNTDHDLWPGHKATLGVEVRRRTAA